MKIIAITQKLREKCPQLRLGCLSCQVEVFPSSNHLLQIIEDTLESFHPKDLQTVRKLPGIAATKHAYRLLGKDPSRYRPSAEALTRRVVNGKGLYSVANVVDILNLVSVSSGFSIGGYDEDKINNQVRMSVGVKDEPYEAIGRGMLNIENLPVLRDASGAFGNPTSDTTRTMVTNDCRHFFMVFFDFGSESHLAQALEKIKALLLNHAGGCNFESETIV